MPEIVLGSKGLNQVISVDTEGRDVTARDLVVLECGRREASLDAGSEAHLVRAKEVSSLLEDEIDRIVEAYLNSVPNGRSLAIEGLGTFTVSQLREEVRNRTAVGEELKATVLQYNRFIEEAIKKGRVRVESAEAAHARAEAGI